MPEWEVQATQRGATGRRMSRSVPPHAPVVKPAWSDTIKALCATFPPTGHLGPLRGRCGRAAVFPFSAALYQSFTGPNCEAECEMHIMPP